MQEYPGTPNPQLTHGNVEANHSPNHGYSRSLNQPEEGTLPYDHSTEPQEIPELANFNSLSINDSDWSSPAPLYNPHQMSPQNMYPQNNTNVRHMTLDARPHDVVQQPVPHEGTDDVEDFYSAYYSGDQLATDPANPVYDSERLLSYDNLDVHPTWNSAPTASQNYYSSQSSDATSSQGHPEPFAQPPTVPHYPGYNYGSIPVQAHNSFTAGAQPSSASIYSGRSQGTVGDEPEFEPRPSLQRSGTTASVSLRTQKTKAVDLSAPPFTKEYIDQYRQRIKTDPDPEAHFLYAKYLVEAARKVGADAKDQRAVKKYREVLVAEALKVIRRLATQGQPYDDAQFYLANCYGTGALGLQVDHERAYHLYLQAAKQNHPAASYRVAVCNEIGAGTRKDPPRACAFYRKAASLGDTPAMYKLGMILLKGALGEERNPPQGIAWLRRAAEQADADNPHALHELGLLHENPNATLVPYDPAYARSLFTQAAHLGYTQSQFKLGQCFEFGALTCPVDPRRSIAWYTKAAEKGDPDAELALSGWYLTGSEGILKQSDSEAYLWARRAANKGLSKAEYAVGYYAEVGIGIKQDIEFAKRWYMRAAAQGNKRAMNRLTEMKRMGNRRAGNIARPTRQQAKDECVIC